MQEAETREVSAMGHLLVHFREAICSITYPVAMLAEGEGQHEEGLLLTGREHMCPVKTCRKHTCVGELQVLALRIDISTEAVAPGSVQRIPV